MWCMIPTNQWNSAENGPLNVSVIKTLHEPAGHFRVSPRRYPAGTSFVGAARAGRVYVLLGACYLAGDQWECCLAAGEFAELPAGDYRFRATGADGVELVRVWELPHDFWR